MSKIFGIKYVCLQNTQRKQNVLKLNKVLITIPSDLVRSFSNIASIANVVQCTSWESDHYDNCQRCQVRVLGSLFDGVCWIFFPLSLYFPFFLLLFTRTLLPERSSLQVVILSACLSVCTYVITSTFPILGRQIVPESCYAQHIIHYWIEDDISDDDDNDKDAHKDKDNDEDKILKRTIICYIFKK